MKKGYFVLVITANGMLKHVSLHKTIQETNDRLIQEVKYYFKKDSLYLNKTLLEIQGYLDNIGVSCDYSYVEIED